MIDGARGLCTMVQKTKEGANCVPSFVVKKYYKQSLFSAKKRIKALAEVFAAPAAKVW